LSEYRGGLGDQSRVSDKFLSAAGHDAAERIRSGCKELLEVPQADAGHVASQIILTKTIQRMNKVLCWDAYQESVDVVGVLVDEPGGV